MIYEFITPSDPITFVAKDNKIAVAVTLLLGDGKAGCKNEHGDSLPTMYLFHSDPLPEIAETLGMDLELFIDAHLSEIADCFASFAYGGIDSRKQYDEAIEAITDEKKLSEFKAKHEDRNRSSMSQWVKQAWKYGEVLHLKAKEASHEN